MYTTFFRVLVIGAFVPHAIAAIDLDREIVLTPPSSVNPADAEVVRWQQRASSDHATAADFERLGWAFVTQARRTLDNGYYKLAERTADVIDRQFGPSPASFLLRGHVDHNLHRFVQAEEIARKLVVQRGMPEDYALLSDALMEQGKLAASIEALQRMADMKPGAEADARIAHLRWLRGDLRGAVQAMESAVRETASFDDETLAWMLTRLGGYALQSGHLDRADKLAASARLHLPDYAPALLLTGRVRLAQNRWPDAVPVLARAASLNPLPEYQWCLAEAYSACGDSTEAKRVEASLLKAGAAVDPRTLAFFLATRDLVSGGEALNPGPDLKWAPAQGSKDSGGTVGSTAESQAVRLARAELGTRQDVLTHDALAWALYADGRVAAAQDEIRAALSEHTADARLLMHAAVIAAASGDVAGANSLLVRCQPDALLPSERALLERATTRLAVSGAPAAQSQNDGLPLSSARDPRAGDSLCSLKTQ